MRIGVLGTGMVGRALAGRSAELGHDVRMGTRDVAAALARPDEEFRRWRDEHPSVVLDTFAATAAHGEVVIHAGTGAAALDILDAAGPFDGKILLDLANPLDFAAGFPPTLSVKDTDSLGEQIQRAHPGARVVKALNTLNADLMARPATLAAGDHSVFVSGNDDAAKAVVTGLLKEFGHTDVIDLGDITTARGTEMFLPLWLRLMQSLGTSAFNIKVVR
ncbi:putative dinucleotide-binding enzyme [Saccharothrix ecbatanensis]|uniref:Putative dinucleotide-binding enzyme n=1 Tax=Saccharothrix ecbatanensis TaxID=1105145 RepID=A0A7W9M2R7_9PSEU|nr:NAD(P)-binding domain-containing protein [Saccharothrix ecbatanensis]MBB5805198.1 putative dinucleotide-binding enzyme [Saccharothrix ecbatanensis]